MNFLINVLLLIFLSVSSLYAAYTEAPGNGFEKKGKKSEEALWLKERFESSKKIQAFNEENLKPLQLADFTDLGALTKLNLRRARKLFRDKKVIVVDSVVGNATRLGNPPGGKGAVEIGKGITFLDAKIIRLAVESELLGVSIPQVLWTSEENYDAVTKLLDTMEERMMKNPNLSHKIKRALQNYLERENTVIMAQATLLPVIDSTGELTEDRFRNAGAGELIPTMIRSGISKKFRFKEDTRIVFSNIDFDAHYIDVIAASIEAGEPDLLQLHVPTKASGGSAYWYYSREQMEWSKIPLEEIEVPKAVLEQVKTLNTNTVVLQGEALNPGNYMGLGIPFEKKVYEGKTYYLPKLSLSDIGKHPLVSVDVAIDYEGKNFYTGSKNSDLLKKTGEDEITKRIASWEKRLAVPFNQYVKEYISRAESCEGLMKTLLR